ncbi:MAG: hypothetical protein HMLKMBBP_03293 [Planctomycetes bacterium]|nr:hypothetical protein [Planctomycetota bacterium]
MSQEQKGEERDVGPGGGGRSPPEPGPTSRGRPGPRPGHARTHVAYTPEERRAAIEAYVKSGLTYEGFARIWGVSSHALYLWMKRYREHGPQGLDHPYGTGRRGRRPLPVPVREEIVTAQRRFPDFGLRRVQDWLARFRGLKVSASGVRSAIEAAGVPRSVVTRRRRRGPEALRRFERARPGELWQSDITSFVLARPGRRVYLVVFLDDHSRYVVSWSLRLRMTAAAVCEALLEGMARFGKPEEVLTDQGPQYHAWRGKSAFRKLLEREGVRQVVARSHHPMTVGKCERLWKTVAAELWDRTRPRDLAEARERLGHYFHHYNFFRPHQGLDGLVPADRFFGAEKAARESIEGAIERNALQLALGERPRTSVFLFGQVGGEQVSLHGERGRLVVSTSRGSREMDLEDLGIEREDGDEQDDAGGRDEGGGDGGGDERDDAGGGAGDPHPAGPGPSPRGPVGAAGLPDAGVLRAGDRRGAETGAPAVGEDPGVLDGSHDQAGDGDGAGCPADPGLAAEPAGGDGPGVRAAHAAEREARATDGSERGREGAAQGERAPAEGERAAAGADRGAARAPGEPGPGGPGVAARGGGGGRCEEAPAAEKPRVPSSAGRCGGGSTAVPLSTGSSASSRSSLA